MNWTQQEAIDICRRMETLVKNLGYHVALTGGCLYGDANGSGTQKDLDIILYEVRQGRGERAPAEIVDVIRKEFKWSLEAHHGWLWQLWDSGRKIDLMFPDQNDGDYYPYEK